MSFYPSNSIKNGKIYINEANYKFYELDSFPASCEDYLKYILEEENFSTVLDLSILEDKKIICF